MTDQRKKLPILPVALVATGMTREEWDEIMARENGAISESEERDNQIRDDLDRYMHQCEPV